MCHLMIISDETLQDEESETKPGKKDTNRRLMEPIFGGEMGEDGERRKTYSAAVIDGFKRNYTIYVGKSIVNLREPFQSAYRMNHSTETDMLRVQNEIILALRDNKVVLHVLIDLSAAFDTVNHGRLLNNLHAIGITCKALAWFTCYHQNRSQTITISGK